MSGYDGNGTFVRAHNWSSDAANAIDITASRFDAEDDAFAAALSNCILRDGQGKPTADIPWNNHRLTGLGAPTDPTDAVTKGYIDVPNVQTPAEIATGVTPTNTIYLSPIGVYVRRFGVVGDGTVDDTAAMALAISSNQPLDIGQLTVRITTRLAFNKANQHVYARGGSFKFDGPSTDRLMDITAIGVEFHGVKFDANAKQVKGALIYVASNAARPKFPGCRFTNINGTHVGGATSNDSNQQYAVLISPYGVEGFSFTDCIFDELYNDNSGVNGTTPQAGLGFVGGIFILTDDWASPDTQQTVPTSGVISNCLFKNIITHLGAGLSSDDQVEFNDGDGVRFYGSGVTTTELYIKIDKCVFYNCSKRAVKNSQASGTMVTNITVTATSDLQYPMVTAVKVDGPNQIVENVNISSPTLAPIVAMIQSHDCTNLRVSKVVADRCQSMWLLTPTSTAVVSQGWRIEDIQCTSVSVNGFISSSVGASFVDCIFDGVTCEAASGVHNLAAIQIVANTPQVEVEFKSLRVINGDVKIIGYGWKLNGYQEINDASYTGFSSTISLLEAGLDVGTTVAKSSHVDGYQLNIRAIPNGYLAAGRPYLWLFYGQDVKVNNFKVSTPASLPTTFSHGSFGGGNDIAVNDFEYDGYGTITAGIIAGPHRRVSMRGMRRIGNNVANAEFLNINNCEDCEISDVFDGRNAAAGTIVISGGTVSAGHTYAYIIDGVRSLTTAANVVTDGGTFAHQANVQKF